MTICFFNFNRFINLPYTFRPYKTEVNRCDFLYFDDRKRSFFLVIFRLGAGLESFFLKNNCMS